MPLIEVYSPPGTFDSASRDLLVAELTSIGMKCEKLPNVPFVQSVVWVYFHDTPMAQQAIGRYRESRATSRR